jgi:catechol 2,3-dioxygenase-like lactoylglutathione lyase family enzyme
MVAARDVAYVRFAAPDVEEALQFLADFGLTVSARENGRTYLRVAGEAHHTYVLSEGPPQFLGFGLKVADRADLEELTRSPLGSEMEKMDEPGGGERVVLTDPDGYRVEIVHGIETVARLPMRDPVPVNSTHERRRFAATVRPPLGPTEMKRVGHVGLVVTSIERSTEWYGELLAMIPTDSVLVGEPKHKVVSFVRCGYPGVYSDHHALALFRGERANFGHVAFETQDFDAVFGGHDYLADRGWRPAWGPGRHELGSQLFDYWMDPWGRLVEHFADSDLFLPEDPSSEYGPDQTRSAWWGPQATMSPDGSGPPPAH